MRLSSYWRDEATEPGPHSGPLRRAGAAGASTRPGGGRLRRSGQPGGEGIRNPVRGGSPRGRAGARWPDQSTALRGRGVRRRRERGDRRRASGQPTDWGDTNTADPWRLASAPCRGETWSASDRGQRIGGGALDPRPSGGDPRGRGRCRPRAATTKSSTRPVAAARARCPALPSNAAIRLPPRFTKGAGGLAWPAMLRPVAAGSGSPVRTPFGPPGWTPPPRGVPRSRRTIRASIAGAPCRRR